MPKVKHNQLTAVKVHTLKAPGVYTDGEGLTLRVSGTGSKVWVLRCTIAGQRHNISLGGYPAIGLAEARRLGREHNRAIAEGRNPVTEKRVAQDQAKAKAAIPTFKQVAGTVIELRRPTWSNARHAKQWTESLQLHAFPVIGDKRVDEVTNADTLAVLAPIWTAKAETATRVRQRMATVFDFAIVQGWRTNNPAGGALAKALPRRPRRKQHHTALPYGDVPAALARILASTADYVTKLAFEFLVLTAARAGEVRGMVWDEVDLESCTWTIPADRMKARREHRVPLSPRASQILAKAKEFTGGQGVVFSSKRTGRPLSNMAFEMLLRRLEIDAVPHGFRSSFRDWTIAETATPWSVGEAALAHQLGNSLESAYARHDLFDRRRGLMNDWVDFLS